MHKVQIGKLYSLKTATKELVLVIGPTTRYRNQPMWEVERLSDSGESRRFTVSEFSLQPLSRPALASMTA